MPIPTGGKMGGIKGIINTAKVHRPGQDSFCIACSECDSTCSFLWSQY